MNRSEPFPKTDEVVIAYGDEISVGLSSIELDNLANRGFVVVDRLLVGNRNVRICREKLNSVQVVFHKVISCSTDPGPLKDKAFP